MAGTRLVSPRKAHALLALGAAFLACGPDSRPPKPCGSEPDFTVLISAEDGPLPASTTVIVAYGSGREEYALSARGRPEILFCKATDANGEPLDEGLGGVGGAAGQGAGGEGGNDSGRRGDDVRGLRCELWTQGPATITVLAEGYAELTEDLRRERSECTLTKELKLEPELLIAE